MNRRQFVALAAACACSGVASGEDSSQRRPPTSEPAQNVVDVGLLAQFDQDGVFENWRESHRFLLIRQEGRLYATAARCTHKGGFLRAGDGELICPMHGSRFDLRGIPTDGPAKSPLPRLAIRLSDQGHVLVEPSTRFQEPDWENPAAFVQLAT